MSYADYSPLIRGLTWNGTSGLLVQYTENQIENALEIELAAGLSPSDALSVLRPVFTKLNGKFPAALNVAGAGAYRLGTRLDILGMLQDSDMQIRRAAGRIAVVTGGAQGFGETLVRGLFAEGAVVAIADMNLDGAQSLAASLNAEAGEERAFACRVNVADEESVSRMVETVVATVGGMDIFVSNAGVLKAGSVKEISLQDFRFVTDVNYIGYFLCTKHVSPVMAAQNSASGGGYFSDIIQINSKSGLEGSNKNGAYAGGKFGGIGLTQSFAMELVADNIKVNSICPGNFFDGPLWSDPDRGLFVQYLKTGKVPGAKSVKDVKKFYEAKVPMGRGCEGGDVLKALFYLVEQKYETGQALPVTGGQVMLS